MHPEGNMSLGKRYCGWENIRIDIKETVGGCGLDSSGLAQGHMASFCEHGNEPAGSITRR